MVVVVWSAQKRRPPCKLSATSSRKSDVIHFIQDIFRGSAQVKKVFMQDTDPIGSASYYKYLEKFSLDGSHDPWEFSTNICIKGRTAICEIEVRGEPGAGIWWWSKPVPTVAIKSVALGRIMHCNWNDAAALAVV